MPDYSQPEAILNMAVPQICRIRHSREFSRTIQVTDEIKDILCNEHIVQVNPELVAEYSEITELCERIILFADEFDARVILGRQAIWDEHREKLERIVSEVEKRWGAQGVQEMITSVLTNGGPR